MNAAFFVGFFESWGRDLAAGDGLAWMLVGVVLVMAVLVGLAVADGVMGYVARRARGGEMESRERARREFLAGREARLREGLAGFRLPEPPVPHAWRGLN